MKKLLFMLTAIALLFVACNKDKEEVQDTQNEETGLSFTIQQTDLNFKDTDPGPECNDELNMDYVKFVLDGVEYTSNIYMIDGEYLTQVIKLDDGTYYLTSFEVYSDFGTPGDMSDDVLVKAAPMPGSEYHDLMMYPLDVEVVILPFYKKQIPVDVLCFEPLFYTEFGFTWFEFNDVRIEYQCIFGDICVDDFELYLESLYANQDNGIQFDMPAIFEIHVYKEGVEEALRVFTNIEWLGEGQCLEVYWPNRLDEEGEVFNFELWVWLPTPNGFEYVLVDTWSFLDGEGAIAGEDGVVDFVIGTCNLTDADYEYDLSYDCYPDLPAPELLFEGIEEWENSEGQLMIRYLFNVPNYAIFPDELFESSPDLPPCGSNDDASRTWVEVFDNYGTRIYGFCALGSAADLNEIHCSVQAQNPQPEGFYIVLEDRRCDISYTSEIIYLAIP